MNLRKLLCGLLALCLLLTMAPAALMEEAPVEEVVVELGGEIEAPEEVVVESEVVAADELMTYDDDIGLVDNVNMTLDVSDLPKDIEAGAEIKSATTSNTGLVKCSWEGTTLTINEGTKKNPKTGSTKITVKLKEKDANDKSSYTINLKVTDKTAPAAVKMFIDGILVESTETWEISDGPVTITAAMFDEEHKDSEDIGEGDTDGYTFLWTCTNKSKITEDKDEETGTLTLTPKAECSVKVTATAKGTNKKASFTLKFVDSYKPQSLKLYADKYEDNENFSKGVWTVEDFDALKEAEADDSATLIELVAEADPDYETPITWSVDNKKVAELTNLDVAKGYDGMVNYLRAKKAGKVKVTAKTYNGKSASVTITIADASQPASISLEITDATAEELLGKKTFDPTDLENDAEPVGTPELVELYAPNFKGDLIKSVLVLDATVKNGLKAEITDEKVLKGLKWTSSKSSVATIKNNKDYPGTATINIKGTGTTKITVTTKNGISKSFNIKVSDSHAPKQIYFLDDDGVTIKSFKMKAGEYAYLNPVLVGTNDPAYQKVTYKSHHTSIATVSSDGEVHALRKGNVKIDVTAYNGKKATITVKISK